MAAQQDPPIYQGFGFALHSKDIEKAVQAVATHPWTSVALTITAAVLVLAYKGLHRRDIENAVTWIIAHPRAGVFMLVLLTYSNPHHCYSSGACLHGTLCHPSPDRNGAVGHFCFIDAGLADI